MKHAILLAGLLSLSFGVHAAPVTVSGFTFNDNGPNEFYGETVEWEEWGGGEWADGSVQGTDAGWAEDDNGIEVAVQGFHNISSVDGGVNNKRVTFVVQPGVDEFDNDVFTPYDGDVLFTGLFTYSDGSGSQFAIDGGVLSPYFSGGLFVWNNTTGLIDRDGFGDMGIGFIDNNFTLKMTATPVSAVPVPAAVWLFGSGLLGMVAVARRRKS